MPLADSLNSDQFEYSSFLEDLDLSSQVVIERLNSMLEPSSTYALIEVMITHGEKGQLEIAFEPAPSACQYLSRTGASVTEIKFSDTLAFHGDISLYSKYLSCPQIRRTISRIQVIY